MLKQIAGRLTPTARRGLVAALVVAVLGVGVLLVMRPTAVAVAPVAVRDVAPVIHAVGTVEAKVTVQVGAKIAGRLTAVLVDQGDAVTAGQLLARLDDAQLVVEVRRAEASVAALAAQVADLEAGTRREEIDEAAAGVARAEAQVDDLLAGARPQEVSELRERVRSAEATRVLAERDLARSELLAARELIAAQDLDRARQVAAVAIAQERAAQHALDLALAGSRPQQIANARAQLQSTRDRLALLRAGPRPHQVAALRAQLAEARAALALAHERHRDSAVTSPFDGVVVSRDLEPGATVNPGTSILKLVDARTTWATVHVDERHTGAVAVGDAATVTLRSMPGTLLAARVARIRRESDRVTEQLAVDLAFADRPARLTLGEQVEARLSPRGRTGVRVVPAGALVRRPDGTGVLTIVEGRVRYRSVRLGAIDAGGWVEVMDGVAVGDVVVVTPGRLADAGNEGRRVRVRTSAGAAHASDRP